MFVHYWETRTPVTSTSFMLVSLFGPTEVVVLPDQAQAMTPRQGKSCHSNYKLSGIADVGLLDFHPVDHPCPTEVRTCNWMKVEG